MNRNLPLAAVALLLASLFPPAHAQEAPIRMEESLLDWARANTAKVSTTATAFPWEAEKILAPGLIEPLVAEPSGKTEKAALEVALRQWAARQDPPDRAALADFFAAHPASPWKPALLGNLGLRALEEGRFTQATFRPEPNTPVSKLQGKREYYARDHWGSVRDVLDQQGNVQTR